MSALIILPVKLASATTPVQFDFISLLAAGETITGQTMTVSVVSGTDANPSALLSGAPSPSGTSVWQNITAGVVGVTYLVSCLVSTSAGQQKILQGNLSVVGPNPYD